MKYENILRVKAHSPEAAIQLREFVQLSKTSNGNFDPGGTFPIPESIMKIPEKNSKLHKNMLGFLYKNNGDKEINCLTLSELRGIDLNDPKYSKVSYFMIDDDYKEGEQAFANMKEFEVSNAEDWKELHWGSPNILNSKITDDHNIYFQVVFITKNNSLRKWLEKVTMDFPLLHFNLSWEDPSKNAFEINANSGKLFQNPIRSIWSLAW